MSNTKIDGVLYAIGDKNQVTENYAKREFIVETLEQYPQHLKIQFANDKCDLLNMYKIGDTVSVDVNLRGRLFVDKNGQTQCFNSLEAWKMELMGINSNNG